MAKSTGIVTRHGRGSFVAENVPQLDPRAAAVRVYAANRSDLREQIKVLEAELATHAAPPPGPRRRTRGPRVLTTEELAEVRDDLVARLEQLDQVRDDLVEVLASIRMAIGEDEPVRERAETNRAAVPRTRPASAYPARTA